VGFSLDTQVFLPYEKPTFPNSSLIRIEDLQLPAIADVVFSLNNLLPFFRNYLIINLQ